MLPIIREVIEQQGFGEEYGGVGFAEVVVDAVGMGTLGGEYMVRIFFSFFRIYLCNDAWGKVKCLIFPFLFLVIFPAASLFFFSFPFLLLRNLA